MPKKKPLSVVVAALVLGLMVGGLTAVVTSPAGAALGINWSKIWKKQIKPRADKRYYTKAKAKQKFAPYPKNIRGVWALSAASSNSEPGFTEIVFPELSAPPTTHYIAIGDPVPTGCSGTNLAPVASPGHLCIFEVERNTMTDPIITPPDFSGTSPNASAFGATIWASSTGTISYITGTYAVRPLALAGKTGSTPDSKTGANPANMP